MGYDEPGRRESADRDQPPGVPAAVLDNVFDDPTHGEPGRDRIAVHVAWELVLLVAVAVLGYLLWRESPQDLRGTALRSLLVTVVALGLLALAAGLSLRTAAPNLAVGPVAVAGALHYAEQSDRGVSAAIVPAVVVAAAGGLLLALAVVALHVPGWAASLAAAAAVVVYIERRSAPLVVQGDYDPRARAFSLFVGFAAVAVLGGLFGAIRAIRRVVGRPRPVADPARRRGAVAATMTIGALVGSTVLAMLAGVLIAANGSDPVPPVPGLDWTVLAIGMALLAGTSAFGRRGGVFGTLLAVVLVALFLGYAEARGWTVSRWAVAGTVLGAGLVVTRLVEAYGRPRPVTGEQREDEPVGDGTISSGWSLLRSGPVGFWPPAPPVRSPVDPWGAPQGGTGPERWDTGDR